MLIYIVHVHMYIHVHVHVYVYALCLSITLAYMICVHLSCKLPTHSSVFDMSYAGRFMQISLFVVCVHIFKNVCVHLFSPGVMCILVQVLYV